MEYDLIVAGAGPAGSSAALQGARLGMKVLLLDRASFPRDKPCGGGISPHTVDLLPFSLEPVIERVIHGMYVSVGLGSGFARHAREPLGYLTQRSRLDMLFAERAQAAGAVLMERTPVQAVEHHDGFVAVTAGKQRFQGRVLVAADGANGPTARLAGVDVRRWLAVALEGNITPRGEFPSMWRETFGMNIGGIPGGYGWIFPKGDHLNIGIGGTVAIGPSLRDRLAQLTRFYGFQPEDLWGTRGHPLPIRQSNSPLRAGNVLLVGDAAGLVDPLSGEGIYYAVRSGQAAARAAFARGNGDPNGLMNYEREMQQQVLSNLHDALQIHDVFHLAPGLFASLVQRYPWAWDAVCRIVRGELDYTRIKHRVPLMAVGVDLLSDAVRARSQIRNAEEDGPAPERFFSALSRRRPFFNRRIGARAA